MSYPKTRASQRRPSGALAVCVCPEPSSVRVGNRPVKQARGDHASRCETGHPMGHNDKSVTFKILQALEDRYRECVSSVPQPCAPRDTGVGSGGEVPGQTAVEVAERDLPWPHYDLHRKCSTSTYVQAYANASRSKTPCRQPKRLASSFGKCTTAICLGGQKTISPNFSPIPSHGSCSTRSSPSNGAPFG